MRLRARDREPLLSNPGEEHRQIVRRKRRLGRGLATLEIVAIGRQLTVSNDERRGQTSR